ncbi:MAG: hypothetical protein ACN6PN_03140 [Sphingobacterium sp.]
MKTLVKRIIGTMSIGVMTLGISLSANAQSVKVEKDVKDEKEVKTSKETKSFATQAVWYDVVKINPSGGDTPSNYRIVGIGSAPSTTPNPNDCAQPNSSGQYCAFQLTFDENEDSSSALEKDVSTAMSDLAATQTGQARNPSHP